MRQQQIVCGVLSAASFATAILAASAQDADPSEPAIAPGLIAKLASDEFAVRQAAATRLLQLGPAVLPAVAAASQSPDPEVRQRCARLHVQLQQRQFDEQLATFINNATNPDSNAPAGWSEFQELMGDVGASRRIFADIYRSDPELLETALGASEARSADTRDLAKLIEKRVVMLQGRNKGHRNPLDHDADVAEEMLALLTVASAAPECITDRATQLLIQLTRTELGALAKGDHCQGISTRRLLSAWITSSTTEDLYVLSQMVQLADSLNLRELSSLAIGIATGQRTVRPAHAQFRAAALLVAGKLGDAEDITSLEPLLQDQSVCASQSGRGTKQERLEDVEVRDVALAVILHLEGKNPADHGFEDSQDHPEKLFVLHSLAFRSEAKRQRATADWRTDRLVGLEQIRIARPDTNSLKR